MSIWVPNRSSGSTTRPAVGASSSADDPERTGPSGWLPDSLRGLGCPRLALDFARHRGRDGVVSASFLEPGDQMAHGNEILWGVDPTYPQLEIRKLHAYTVEACLRALAAVDARATVEGLEDGRDQWLGYLLFDAWIANLDRHHENWAVVRRGARTVLAPTYDHAASLGRNLPLDKIRRRLAGDDLGPPWRASVRGRVPRFARKHGKPSCIR